MVPLAKITGRLGNQLFQFAYIFGQMKRGMIPDIYVQNPVYFEDYKEELKMLFGNDIGHMNHVAIHVRRGGNPVNKDEPKYCNNSFYVDLFKTDYYKKAMEEFTGETFMIFSDDIEWCKEQAIFKSCHFSEEKDEIKDFNKMASCKGIIMANSSFSWWAAYLGNANKVIAPKNYYADGVNRTKYPKEWKQL